MNGVHTKPCLHCKLLKQESKRLVELYMEEKDKYDCLLKTNTEQTAMVKELIAQQVIDGEQRTQDKERIAKEITALDQSLVTRCQRLLNKNDIHVAKIQKMEQNPSSINSVPKKISSSNSSIANDVSPIDFTKLIKFIKKSKSHECQVCTVSVTEKLDQIEHLVLVIKDTVEKKVQYAEDKANWDTEHLLSYIKKQEKKINKLEEENKNLTELILTAGENVISIKDSHKASSEANDLDTATAHLNNEQQNEESTKSNICFRISNKETAEFEEPTEGLQELLHFKQGTAEIEGSIRDAHELRNSDEQTTKLEELPIDGLCDGNSSGRSKETENITDSEKVLESNDYSMLAFDNNLNVVDIGCGTVKILSKFSSSREPSSLLKDVLISDTFSRHSINSKIKIHQSGRESPPKKMKLSTGYISRNKYNFDGEADTTLSEFDNTLSKSEHLKRFDSSEHSSPQHSSLSVTTPTPEKNLSPVLPITTIDVFNFNSKDVFYKASFSKRFYLLAENFDEFLLYSPIGILNHGATFCYLNSVLQALSNIAFFALNTVCALSGQEGSLFHAMYETYKFLWIRQTDRGNNNRPSYLTAGEVRNFYAQERSITFDPTRQHDADEFMTDLIENLELEALQACKGVEKDNFVSTLFRGYIAHPEGHRESFVTLRLSIADERIKSIRTALLYHLLMEKPPLLSPSKTRNNDVFGDPQTSTRNSDSNELVSTNSEEQSSTGPLSPPFITVYTEEYSSPRSPFSNSPAISSLDPPAKTTSPTSTSVIRSLPSSELIPSSLSCNDNTLTKQSSSNERNPFSNISNPAVSLNDITHHRILHGAYPNLIISPVKFTRNGFMEDLTEHVPISTTATGSKVQRFESAPRESCKKLNHVESSKVLKRRASKLYITPILSDAEKEAKLTCQEKLKTISTVEYTSSRFAGSSQDDFFFDDLIMKKHCRKIFTPEILCVSLDRHNYDLTYNSKILPADNLVIPADIRAPEGTTKPAFYKLMSIIQYVKKDSNSGHYYTYVKTETGDGYLLNDNLISLVDNEKFDLTAFGGRSVIFVYARHPDSVEWSVT